MRQTRRKCLTCHELAEYGLVPPSGVLHPYCFSCHLSAKSGPLRDATRYILIHCVYQRMVRVDAGRASGYAICVDCEKELRKHPRDFDHPYMKVLCNGALVKL